MCAHPGCVTEELGVGELVDLVRSDGTVAQVLEVQATVSREPARKATPAPAKVIFDVEANMIGRFG